MVSDDYQPTKHPGDPSGPYGFQAEREQSSKLGKRLLDRYEIFGVREGGFGVVYFVTDLENRQDYAVKTYKPEFAGSLSNVQQFRSEASFWINLDPHPNIVKAKFIEIIEAQPHLFMEYVNGGPATSLRDWLRGGHIDSEHAINFAYQLCLGMEFANQRREIAHCDLKPENLLINKQGVLKISDFGLAQQIEVRHGKYPRVDSGTWAYAAPEQFAGQAVNTQTDLYAFGILFFELLTHKLPFPFLLSSDPQTQYKQLFDFHSGNGARELAQEIYYTGIPYVDGAGHIIGDCMQQYSANRPRNFRMLRETLENKFGLRPPDYLADDKSVNDNAYQRAISLREVQQFSEALSIFNSLLQQKPDDGRLWLEAAKTLSAMGQRDSAVKFLKQALHLDPTLEEADRLLEL